MLTTNHNPDVLSCLANLSNDEVFTPPNIANAMLDLLPPELFKSSKTTFLDPACKSGVFLREIAKRLIDGLAEEIPDLQKRLDHIFTKQLFGIAITELTAHLSRRSLYCSKTANGQYSVAKMKTADGNILFNPIKHMWENGRCKFCGAAQSEYDRADALESHAYQFIHTTNPKELLNMKFDVIVGNPPYQLSDGGNGASARPIYHLFVEQAMKLRPRYMTLIIPARWYTGGKGLDDFRQMMINDKRIRILHDFPNASECFSGVEIKGGVCYFLWNRDSSGLCDIYKHNDDEVEQSFRYLVEDGDNIFIREAKLISIKNKVWAGLSFVNDSFENIVSSRKPYGLAGDFFANPKKYDLPPLKDRFVNGDLKILGLSGLKRVYKYVSKKYPLPKSDMLMNYKIFVPRNVGSGEFGDFTPQTVVARPEELCTETFIQIGPFKSLKECENADAYLKTKFFRALISARKLDQGASRAIYHYVPLQDFSKPWTDEELYAKYKLTKEEIAFIESMIRPME